MAGLAKVGCRLTLLVAIPLRATCRGLGTLSRRCIRLGEKLATDRFRTAALPDISASHRSSPEWSWNGGRTGWHDRLSVCAPWRRWTTTGLMALFCKESLQESSVSKSARRVEC